MARPLGPARRRRYSRHTASPRATSRSLVVLGWSRWVASCGNEMAPEHPAQSRLSPDIPCYRWLLSATGRQHRVILTWPCRKPPVQLGGANPERTTCVPVSRHDTHEYKPAAQSARDGTRRHQPRARVHVRDEECPCGADGSRRWSHRTSPWVSVWGSIQHRSNSPVVPAPLS